MVVLSVICIPFDGAIQRCYDRAEIVDLQGRTVIPGLIDNHVHAIRAATWAEEVRLDEAGRMRD
jgi:predicted amidohydrolase YtcJ